MTKQSIKLGSIQIAKELSKNKKYSEYVSCLLAKEYSPIKFDGLIRKARLKNNRAFFNKVAKKAMSS